MLARTRCFWNLDAIAEIDQALDGNDSVGPPAPPRQSRCPLQPVEEADQAQAGRPRSGRQREAFPGSPKR